MDLHEKLSYLGWAIIELKIAYYHPHLIHESWKSTVFQPDSFYDALEDEYRKLSNVFGRAASACDMVGADFERPSVRLALSLIGQPKGINKCSIENFIPSQSKKAK